MKMALLSPSPPPLLLLNNTSLKTSKSQNQISFHLNFTNPKSNINLSSLLIISRRNRKSRYIFRSVANSQLCTTTTHETITLDRSSILVHESSDENELWAAACLRARTFFVRKEPFHGTEDHIKYMAEREFEALKERIAGKRIGFKRVSCINATVPLSRMSGSLDDLCSVCKYSDNGEGRLVIGTLDLNQCLRLPDEITGKRPEGIGSDFARAYLSNVCVAKELHKNGVGSSLVAMSKNVAKEWGNDP
ncbi:hypothetical protein IFM89_010165 [Coptis chinensis]|uniref:N-acetyltransferase domain-containing protein n=1 Tax=Coptis chinensis TaxID=261450 RepID=A0A835IDD1_9MAGN|nr:hypothetical protein IFM89_010165 [Coptis chinensis]